MILGKHYRDRRPEHYAELELLDVKLPDDPILSMEEIRERASQNQINNVVDTVIDLLLRLKHPARHRRPTGGTPPPK
jgi:hypothetical protein